MTGREAARYLRVSHRMVLQWAKEGRIPAHRLSGTARATGATARERHGSVYNSLKHWDGRRECGEFPPQALVVLLGGGEPHAVVSRLVAFVAKDKDKDDLVLNIDRKAAEMKRVRGDSGAIVSRTNSCGTGLRCLTA
jgi:excisionase family DNA binding protein